MRYKPLENRFYKRNREKLTSRLSPGSLVLFFSNDEAPRNGDQTFYFRQNSDLLYVSGLDQEKTVLALFPDHPDRKSREIVFTIKTNKHLETWEGHKFTPDEVRRISGIETVKWMEELEPALHALFFRAEYVYVNLNEQEKFKPETADAQHRMLHKLQREYPGKTFLSLAPLLCDLRMKKEPEEIEMMQKACNITRQAFYKVMDFVQPGVMEYEVEALMTWEFLRNGAQGHAYAPIVASGKNATVLHYVDNDAQCKDGDLLLMDFGAEYGNYAADCSRTIPVNGSFTEEQKRFYNEVLHVQKQAIQLMKPGITLKHFNEQVNKLIEESHIRLGLYSRDEAQKAKEKGEKLYFRYYMHGAAHHIGLDVHDVNDKFAKFERGMVLTCEPGFYDAERGIGIRIEDNIMIENSPRNLTEEIPKEIAQIENYMNKRS